MTAPAQLMCWDGIANTDWKDFAIFWIDHKEKYKDTLKKLEKPDWQLIFAGLQTAFKYEYDLNLGLL